jgi:hypothetical protein
MKLSQLLERLADSTKGYVARALQPLEQRQAALEAAIKAIPAPAKGDKGDPGKDAPAVDVDAIAEKVLARVVPPRDGKDADPEVIRSEVAKAVAAIPRPKDGEPGKDAAPVDVDAIAASVLAKVRVPQDGKDADPAQVQAAVEKAVASIPKPKDGEPGKDASVDVEAIVRAVRALVKDGKDADPEFIRAEVSKAVAEIPRPKDGESVHPDTVALMLRREVDAALANIKLPKDGDDGAPGRDALAIDILPTIDETKSYPRGTFAEYRGGTIRAIRNTDPITGDLASAGWSIAARGVWEETEELLADGRTTVRKTKYTCGTVFERKTKSAQIIYRDIFRPETEYDKGDIVTFGGSTWHCMVDKPTDKPGISDQWRLIVKKGAPGKDAVSK